MLPRRAGRQTAQSSPVRQYRGPTARNPLAQASGLTEQELARHLKICRRQLYSWRMSGLIPYLKLGKAVRFRMADVAAAIERMRAG